MLEQTRANIELKCKVEALERQLEDKNIII